MSSAGLRPGVARGAYPERREEPPGYVDRTLHELRGRWSRLRPPSRASFEAQAQRARELSDRLEKKSEAALAEHVRELRQRLTSQVQSDDLLVRGFAAVREVARRTLGLAHYDVQLMSGLVMARGMLAEMETGEGKTLSATLPACVAALSGIPVHVISVNDYLVERDAEAMRPVYQGLGLTVGAVTEQESDPELRRATYACDVTYGTAKTIAFDYLRDVMARGARRERTRLHVDGEGAQAGSGLLLRGLCFAVVDEADSVLIDEARTPLILSGPGAADSSRGGHLPTARAAPGRCSRRTSTSRIDVREGRGRADGARPRSGSRAGQAARGNLERTAATRGVGRPARSERPAPVRARRHYIVRDDKVEIVDQLTGRRSPDRSWERGLHQMIEVKEGVPAHARARDAGAHQLPAVLPPLPAPVRHDGHRARGRPRALESVYRLQTVVVPTRRPSQRRDASARASSRPGRGQVAARRPPRARALGGGSSRARSERGSVAASEQLSDRLTRERVAHRVLNARQDADEAAIVAEGGSARTDHRGHQHGRPRHRHPPWEQDVAERGGLHVIATQRSEAGRIDRQLFGRCARQGDPGSHECALSLQDEPMARHFPVALLRLLSRGGLPRRLGVLLTRLPQRAEEIRHARMRVQLVHMEAWLDEILAFSGQRE